MLERQEESVEYPYAVFLSSRDLFEVSIMDLSLSFLKKS